jgi:hypothetical protein
VDRSLSENDKNNIFLLLESYDVNLLKILIRKAFNLPCKKGLDITDTVVDKPDETQTSNRLANALQS